MKILFLGYGEEKTYLIDFLRNKNHLVCNLKKNITSFDNFDLIISFGYQYIIKKELLKSLNRPIINLHISYLPFNKGAHPNFWSHYENTQSGVTIHEIDSGIDTGPIIAQKKVTLDENLTLSASYQILIENIQNLFIENYSKIINYSYKKIPHSKELGTFHIKKELPEWVDWEMTIKQIKNHRK